MFTSKNAPYRSMLEDEYDSASFELQKAIYGNAKRRLSHGVLAFSHKQKFY